MEIKSSPDDKAINQNLRTSLLRQSGINFVGRGFMACVICGLISLKGYISHWANIGELTRYIRAPEIKVAGVR